MGMLCAVSFNRYGRLYYLDPGPHQISVGDKVLVPTDDGPEVAECVWAPQWVSARSPCCSMAAAAQRTGRRRRR